MCERDRRGRGHMKAAVVRREGGGEIEQGWGWGTKYYGEWRLLRGGEGRGGFGARSHSKSLHSCPDFFWNKIL